MDVLFLVHIEEMFRGLMDDDYPDRICEAIPQYDRVVILDSDVGDGILEEVVPHYKPWMSYDPMTGAEIYIWSWGYEKGQVYEEGEDADEWVIGSLGHEWTWVPVWLRGEADILRRHNVFVGGGANGECLMDWECVLDHLDIPYTLVDELVFG